MKLLNQLLAINPNYLLIGLMAVFYSLEHLLPTENKFNKRPQHLFNNIAMGVVLTVANIIWATVAVITIDWLNNHHVGLLYLVNIPVWLQLIVGVMLFDFTSYWFHRLAHNTPLIWRLHRVHHSDTSLDASSNFRGHPLELMFWFGTSSILAAAIFGLSNLSMALYFLILTPLFFLEHTNVRFPGWMDRTIGLVFTTPNIHKVHHEQDQYYTDSNYADIFILWDRLFGTFKYKAPEQINFGLKEFDEDKKQTFWYLLMSPFLNVRRVTSKDLHQQSVASMQETPTPYEHPLQA